MYRQPLPKRKSRKKLYVGLTATVAIIVAVGLVSWILPDTTEAPQSTPKQETTSKKPKPKEVKPVKVDLQPTIDTWVASQSGDYGIVVYDPANKAIIASHQADKTYFAASIYKLYVAYLALIDIQSGAQNPDKVVLAGQTLKECIHKMIHSSDSPCGETVLNSMGQATVTQRLKSDFGLTGTSFPAFMTSAQDAATILQRLQAKQDLNPENTNFLLEAMKTQIYRNGVPAGMPDAVVADKIGFNTPEHWHDTGIVTLPNGREYIVSILGGGGVSSANIADFARTIFARLN